MRGVTEELDPSGPTVVRCHTPATLPPPSLNGWGSDAPAPAAHANSTLHRVTARIPAARAIRGIILDAIVALVPQRAVRARFV